jgi:tetratricopeptide (TPR) repeat protein
LYVDGKWVHHDVQPRCRRTLSEADLRNPLSQTCSRRLGLRRGSGSLELGRKLSTENFLNNGILDKALGEEFEDSDTHISIGFQSARDPLEESGDKNMAAIGTHGGEGYFVSGRRNEDFMGGRISEGPGVALVCDGAVVGSKTETGFVNGGFGGEDGGGFSGGGGHGGRGGGFGSDSNNMDAYYKKMLQADPGNPLLLTNYARFLQEVQHDLEKAEEYYRRAILASPGDGDVLSLYANLIWDVYKDAPRAQAYYDQAVEAAPDDCNVLGSYAYFLWNAKDDEEVQNASQQQKMAPPTYFGTAITSAT